MTVKTVPATKPSEKLTRVKILSGVTIGPGLIAEAGETWELPRADAIMLVGANLAELDEGETHPKDEGIGVQTVTHSDRDPKPQKVATPPHKR